MLQHIKTKRLIREKIQALRNAIDNSNVYHPKEVSKFIFLCGANKNLASGGGISERRSALIEFSKEHLSHTQFLLAEKIFNQTYQSDTAKNILHLEHSIASFADHILIVLESESAFTELGAFSHSKLLEKLIVINNVEYRNSTSFINLGPLLSIKEKSGDKNIIYYKMSSDGVHIKDAIGDAFQPLHDLLKEPIKNRVSSLKINDCNPSLDGISKPSAMLIHDLIYFTGPIKRKELIEVLIQIFGNHSYNNLSDYLAILTSFESLELKNTLYRSKLGKTYYDYRFDVTKVISTFRNCVLQNYPERIYGY